MMDESNQNDLSNGLQAFTILTINEPNIWHYSSIYTISDG